jgi:hypothetical protein
LQTPDHDLVVPASSQRAGASVNTKLFSGVIHTEVSNFFIGLGEPGSEDISRQVIRLLNSPISLPDFAPFGEP